MLDLHIKDIDNKNLKQLQRFLEYQDLGYNQYNHWINRICIPELNAGYKQGYIVNTNNIIIATLIFQTHKELSQTLELKNLRVDNRFRGRDIAHFLLKNAEVFARRMGYKTIIGDFRANKDYSFSILKLLLFSGYKVLFKAGIYKDGCQDYVVGMNL
jgi:ribosomal protein S18 acetylase RimI-like enzyme